MKPKMCVFFKVLQLVQLFLSNTAQKLLFWTLH